MPRRHAPERRAGAGLRTLAMSFFRLLQVSLERGELANPQSLGIREPRLELRHRFGAQPIDADARIEFIALLFDESAPAQGLQMSAHRGKGDARRLRELSCPMGPLAEEVDDAPAMRISQRCERTIEGRRAQSCRSNLKRVAFSIACLETSRSGCAKVQWCPSGSQAM